MTAAPVTATCTAVFPLVGGPAVTCDRQPHTTRLHTAETGGVPFAWSDRDTNPLPDWEQATLDAVRAVYGNDLPRTRHGRIEAVGCAMLTLNAHEWIDGANPHCVCGWPDAEADGSKKHAQHVAEQLYATGALDPRAPAVAVVLDRVADLAHRMRGRPSSIGEINAVIAAHDALTGGGA
jgi:hypothetical protein